MSSRDSPPPEEGWLRIKKMQRSNIRSADGVVKNISDHPSAPIYKDAFGNTF
jgi:hypothetical protein